jgi:hypothetical protein
MADQESRGGNGDSGSGEERSVMRLNLAEGCEAVNDETRGRAFPSTSISFMLFVLFVRFEEQERPDKPADRTNRFRFVRRVVLVGGFSV